jgi:sec-independent protein translocase protein TatC
MGKQMSFLDHLEELRKHLIRIFIVVILFAIVAFVFSKYIFDYIIFAIAKPNFVTYKVMCKITSGAYCFDSITYNFQSLEMGEQFSTDIWMAITFGIIFAFPFILWEIWKFISPALYTNEKKHAVSFIIVASLLFFLGVFFGYFIIAPLSINFFGNYKVNELVSNDFKLSSFIGLIKTSVLASGVMFELPVIIFFLAKLGLVDSEGLKKYRKIMLIVILALSAIITPPDILSQIIVAIPVMALYELSIYIAKFMEKKEKSLVKK